MTSIKDLVDYWMLQSPAYDSETALQYTQKQTKSNQPVHSSGNIYHSAAYKTVISKLTAFLRALRDWR